MVYIYMLTFTINIPQMLAYIAYTDPMGPWVMFLVSPYHVGNAKILDVFESLEIV